ncbi:M23 family metallopeptidase [Janthinobacterium sp. 17J80-10]|uniref:M23 family metallopeptidase n=1 Tax=Janthinobacterium sp. 17J80-10 TaxID=2497863 RepID=UPI001005487A|nr:M23 family metallopeptidase [Janthinobacterium sp. 17J80-10]QAU35759.1 M23 family metallopeptidase [Janthinobacterium sp. 17J80-10]
MFSRDKLIDLGARGKALFGVTRKSRVVSYSALFLALCAFGAAGVAPMAPDAADLPVKTVALELALPDLQSQIAAQAESTAYYVREEKVRPGDSLATLLKRLGVDDAAAAEFIKNDHAAYQVLQLKPGKQVQVQTDADGELQWLRTTLGNGRDAASNLLIERDGAHFKAKQTPAALEQRVEMRSGEIRSSLFAATDQALIPDNVALQIVEMFSTDIDFASDLRRGDRFNVVYETLWQNGEYVRAGRVLAAEFVNGGRSYQAVWFEDPASGQGGGYFGFDGKSLKKAFLKSPLEFSRISSGFSMRKHPISGKWKAHKGVDFAAVTGTPIRAAADGVVHFAGVQGGYGNVVEIKHWSNYSTAYAHMSRFASGLRKGMKVSQGQLIGYVGSTGWSTGPHLHYEFRVSNEARDPLKVDMPTAQPLAGGQLQRFRGVTSDMLHRFALLNPQDQNTRLASAK